MAPALFLILGGFALAFASGRLARWMQERQPPFVEQAWGGRDVTLIMIRVFILAIAVGWMAVGFSKL